MKLVAILLLFAVPMLEIGVLIKVGQWLGFWPMLAIIIGTAVLGAAIISHEGLSAPFKAQEAMRRGEPPAPKMFESALAMAGGVLLFTPGLIADGIGLLLQVPLVRRLVGRWLIMRYFSVEDVTVQRRPEGDLRRGPRPDPRDPAGTRQAAHGDRPRDGPVIDGEFERLEERTLDPRRPRPNGGDRR